MVCVCACVFVCACMCAVCVHACMHVLGIPRCKTFHVIAISWRKHVVRRDINCV